MPTLMEEIRTVVLVKYEFEYRENLKSKCFSLEFSDYQDTDARKKHLFLVEYSSTGSVFSIVTLMEEIELVVAEI